MYDMEIKLLTENKKVIPLIYGMDELWTTNVKLPNIIVANNDLSIIEIITLEVVGICEEKEVLKLMLDKDEISTFVKQIIPKINSMIKDGKQKGYDTILGKFHITDEKLTDKIVLNPYECTIIPLSKMLFLNYTGTKVIDTIGLNIFVKGELDQQVLSKKIKLEQYKNKENYIFPMKDKVCITNLPMSINNHRQCLSQEFAFDVVGQSDVKSLALESKPNHISNYYIYHKNVMAIGDGIVIDVGDKFRESMMSNPNNYSDEYMANLFKKLIPEIGGINAACGNYVTIDHENGEFSFYAHLSENTICVKKGERIKQGTIIGKVGNTGNSTDPHLHFQLMDCPNMLEANGLPIMFQNINYNSINFNLTEANSLVFSDLLYVDVK